jgi:hypothetical protein
MPNVVEKLNIVTFYADITDIDGDYITANVCSDVKCNEIYCAMSKTREDTFSCEYVTSAPAIYTYYIKATDSRNANATSSAYKFRVTDAIPECTRDNDCSRGSICISSACVEGCRTDLDCAFGKECKSNACVRISECTAHSDCLSKGSCYCENGACISCQPGSVCSSNACMEKPEGIDMMLLVLLIAPIPIVIVIYLYLRVRLREQKIIKRLRE